jgi:acylphosphatase
VNGRVQGVFFRDGCRAEALRLDVAGWARNLPDGRVEVVLEGPEDAVATVEAWCARGPRRARVERVEIRDEPVAGDTRFEVR